MNIFLLVLGLGILLILFGLSYIKPLITEGFESSSNEFIKIDNIEACKTINQHIESYQNIMDGYKKEGKLEYSIRHIMQFMAEFQKAHTKYECSSQSSIPADTSSDKESIPPLES